MKTNAHRLTNVGCRVSKNGGASVPPRKHNRGSAFTLLEVMIACGIFFIAMFAILGLVSNCLRNARALRHIEVDAGMVAA